ncbi:MAG: tripartite tricarboxylate transporter permease [Rhodospirillales bacterium]|nr:tripartite tricarboxylate transporter permease [Rhodospirillales bacterium]
MISDILQFLESIVTYADPWHLGLMAGSMCLGIIFGTLPGLNATLGVALLIGITYPFGPTTAIIMIMGLYVGAIYAGSLSAILVNIPGTGSAAATCLDGHALARQGKAIDAIVAARLASFVGSMLGVLMFILCAPFLTELALQFTSPEYFWLCIFGIFVCGTLAAADLPIKGWISGMIGMMLSFIGLEDLLAYERFTYGSMDLITGLPWVPMMIGLFAIPQVIVMINEATRRSHVVHAKRSIEIFKSLKDNIVGIVKWAVTGVGIGALPGVGENIAAWAAYGMAKQSSKKPEEFGKGAIAGVMAPEVANNAAIAGAVLVLLVLGVPGSPPTAVLMGALQIHNIRPGPMLGVDFPTFLFDMGAWLFWASIMLLVIGILSAKPMSLILRVPPKILAPLIAILCVCGSYTVANDMFHVYVVAIAGIVGYFLEKFGYHPAPLVLGFVLGLLTDHSFRRALDLAEGNPIALINRPIAFIFFAVTVIILIQTIPAVRRWRDRRIAAFKARRAKNA